MKRAQSVEVLSILAEASPRPQRAVSASSQEEEVEEDTYYQASGPPPQESPPPLPPREREVAPPVPVVREREAPAPSPAVKEREAPAPAVHSVLHNTPALVNDSIVLVEKEAAPAPAPARPQPKAAAAVTKPKPTKQPAANAKKSSQSRPSAGVLFGVKDRELPAPDTVRETRKLFESGGGGGGQRRFTSKGAGGLTKSKSTSSLYTRPNSRSSSQEKQPAGLGRKKSEEDLHRTALTSSRGSASPSRRTPSSPRRTTPRVSSPGRPLASSPAAASPRPQSKAASSHPSPRPSIPAKPSHLSPATRPSSYRRSTSSPATPQPPLPARGSAPGIVKATPANVVPSGPKAVPNIPKVGPSVPKAVPSEPKVVPSVPKVVTILPKDVPSVPQVAPSIPKGLHSVSKGVPSIPKGVPNVVTSIKAKQSSKEEGVKRISEESIQNIRSDGPVFNISLEDQPSGPKSHLPAAPVEAKNILPKQVIFHLGNISKLLWLRSVRHRLNSSLIQPEMFAECCRYTGWKKPPAIRFSPALPSAGVRVSSEQEQICRLITGEQQAALHVSV